MFDRLKIQSRNRLGGIARNEDGSILIFSLFVFVMMLMVSGLAIDFMRTETKRAEIQGTLDRAILAAASMEQSLDAETVVQDYFARAGLSQYLQSVTVVETGTNKTVNAVAHANVSPFFLKMLGYEKLPAKASGTAREGFSLIEVSLILDISGSMGWTSPVSGNKKLEDLKDAAQEFVYRVMCNPDTANLFADPCTVDPDTVSVNLVMYNEFVVVGEGLLQYFNITNEHSYSSCVDMQHAEYFNTAITATQPLQRSGHIDARTKWYKSNSTSHLARESRRSCKPNANHEIMPLVGDWQALYDRIELLSSGGYTSIEMGMKWGTALLDPSFRVITPLLNVDWIASGGTAGVDPVFANRPADFTNNGVEKFVVLMTDGENTLDYQLKPGYYSGLSEVFYDDDANGDGVLDDPAISVYRKSMKNFVNPMTGGTQSTPWGDDPRQLDFVEVWEMFGTDFYNNGQNNSGAHNWLPNPVNQTAPATKNADLVAICAAARGENVTIYTIGFETTVASTAVMKKCASSHAHHFDVDGGSIDDAFAAIARDIQKLKLVN